MYLTISGDIDCISLQDDLNKLAYWEGKWKIKFHLDKCQVISISHKRKLKFNYNRHNHILQHVKSAKYIGCTINDQLHCGEHINNICNRANRNLSFI